MDGEGGKQVGEDVGREGERGEGGRDAENPGHSWHVPLEIRHR